MKLCYNQLRTSWKIEIYLPRAWFTSDDMGLPQEFHSRLPSRTDPLALRRLKTVKDLSGTSGDGPRVLRCPADPLLVLGIGISLDVL
jgi:hypothetical protein